MTTQLSNCPVCNQPGAQVSSIVGDSRAIDCTRCGEFEIAETAVLVLAKHSNLRVQTSQAIVELERASKDRPLITTYTLHEMFPAELGPIQG